MISQHLLASRKIVERIVVEGDLVLRTPAHLGSGEQEGTVSLSLLRDPYDGAALLPGPSIAGALRSYWRERKWGYGAKSKDSELFGAARGAHDEMEGHQSLLIVDDAFGPAKPQVELRDGVKIDGATRTAEEKKLFDIEVLRAGTRFRLRFELLVPQGKRTQLCQDLAVALQGFQDGEIGLGARKQRGLGRCRVERWHVWRYDLTTSAGLLDWLAEGREDGPGQAWRPVREAPGDSLPAQLGIDPFEMPDRRERFEMIARLALAGSLLIRSGSGQADVGPDAIHLHRTLYQDTGDASCEPVVPGASLAGVLRAQALRIANTLLDPRAAPGRASELVDAIFGTIPKPAPVDADPDDPRFKPRASRLKVHETTVDKAHSLVQSRIRIDRFTGGVLDNYLFGEEPLFGGPASELTLALELRGPNLHEYEIGLLLLLLKDVWTGDLPVGGEASIGRGRLQGVSAEIKRVRENGATNTWALTQTPAGLPVDDKTQQDLQGFVQALLDYLARR